MLTVSASLGKSLAMLADMPLGDAVGMLSSCQIVGDELRVSSRLRELGEMLEVVGSALGDTTQHSLIASCLSLGGAASTIFPHS